MFYKIWVNANKKDGEEGKNEYVPFEARWQDVPGRDEEWKRQTIANTSLEQWSTEFESEFLGSLHTLILPDRIKALAYKTPIIFNAEGFATLDKNPLVTKVKFTPPLPPDRGFSYLYTW